MLPLSVFGWGYHQHRLTTAAAIEELPPPLRAYFQRYASRVTNRSGLEPPGTHWILIDLYPEFYDGTFPRDLNVLIGKYGNDVVQARGTGPWTAASHYETLRSNFAIAQTPADWTNVLVAAETLAHFLEDLHNPMHLTRNYDGHLTGQAGLHNRYETFLMDNRFAAGFTVTPNPTGCVFHANMTDAIFDSINQTHPCNVPLLAADNAAFADTGERDGTNYYQHLWDDGCSDFTPGLLQRAANMVASAWYSAWREAGFPRLPDVEPSLNVRLQPLGSTNGVIRFAIRGDAGQRLDLEVSKDMVTWVRSVSVTNLDGHSEVSMPAPEESVARFYRAVLSAP